MTTTEKHNCEKCGKPFVQAKPWQLFCSTRCRVNAHQAERYTNRGKAFRALQLIVADLSKIEPTLSGTAADTVRKVIKRAQAFD